MPGKIFALAFSILVSTAAQADAIDVRGWTQRFAFHHDYIVQETRGLARTYEPVEVTLSVPGADAAAWENAIRVVALNSDTSGAVVPHQTSGKVSAATRTSADGKEPLAAQSINVVFLASCPAHKTTTYRLFWGIPQNGNGVNDLPGAPATNAIQCTGDAPGLSITNDFYYVELSPKSGALLKARLAGRNETENLFYGATPIHFGVDVWSPPQGWDHDYDWPAPPNQKLETGPLMVRYHRWGPLAHYPDVQVSITYTFYAHVPYVHISSTMDFTENRAVRAVRMGEIVVAHSHRAGPNEKDADGKSPDLLSHYAWPDLRGKAVVLDVDAHRNSEGAEQLEDTVAGAIAVLDRDVPWVAGYNTAKKYGVATLRASQFSGNRLGAPTPQSAPCTYVSNYGWGFTYWSRPMVYPPGEKGSPEDQNTAVAAGTFFGIDEALLFFAPDKSLDCVREAHQRFTNPLHRVFRGTGPW